MGGINRKLRRQIERQNKMSTKEIRERIMESSEAAYQQLAKDQRERNIEQDSMNGAKIMWCTFGLVLHREFGFGQQRIIRAYKAIDKEMESWADGKSSAEDTMSKLARQLKEETGVEIEV